jgi:hypothetical protein
MPLGELSWQHWTVGLIVCAAAASLLLRLVRFFRRPPSACGGCQGCGQAAVKTPLVSIGSQSPSDADVRQKEASNSGLRIS